MTQEGYKEVTRDEFRAFLAAYPIRLEHHCTTICDPEMHGYYDFSKATSPIGTTEAMLEAMQAYCIYGDARNGNIDKFCVRAE